MERLKHLERERVRLEIERDRQMQRFQREKDLDSRQKRHDKSPLRHKSKRTRYPPDETGQRSRNSERHRKREARSYKEDPYNLMSSQSPKEERRPIDLDYKSDGNISEDKNIFNNLNNITSTNTNIITTNNTNNITNNNTNNITNNNDIMESYNIETDEYNTIEVNIRDEDEDEEEEEEEESYAVVEEGELAVESKEDDFVNAYKMARSKFDDEDEEEDGEEEEIEDVKEVDEVNSAGKSDASVEEDVEDDHSIEEADIDTDDRKDIEITREMPPRAPTPPSPPTPKTPTKTQSPSDNLPPFYPAIQGCRNVEEFHCLNRVEEGTYGVVYRAVDRKTEDIVALKRLKMEKESEGFPITSLREINTLLTCTHENVVKIREVVVGSNMDKIYLVMDFVEHDLKSLMEYMKEPFLIGEVKTLMIQLMSGVAHLHDNWVVHRDLKTSNLLLSSEGVLKIGDFGLAREYGSPLKPYTPIVVTLWYRAPELLLGQKVYSTPIDMWSVGCIFAELVQKKPLFAGRSELDQLNKIFKELGTPSEKIWPGVSELPGFKSLSFTEHSFNKLSHKFDKYMSAKGFDLMNLLLTYCPDKRLTAEEALKHSFFTEVPIPVESAMFPTWPSKSELRQGKIKIGRTPKAPSGGEAYAKMVAEEEQVATGFMLKSSQKPGGFALRF